MQYIRILPSAALAALLATTMAAPRPALADGAASTRNIIFGAAAIGGALLIINHNKKVHEKYAEYDQRQAATQAQANQAQAAYESEAQAYSHEAALVSEYKKEVAYQHDLVQSQNRQLAGLRHSLAMAHGNGVAESFAQPAARSARPSQPHTDLAENVSYGWGTY